MDSKWRRKKQQIRKPSSPTLRRRRRQPKVEKRKIQPPQESRQKKSRNRKVELNSKDRGIKLLILIFIGLNIYLVFNFIKQMSNNKVAEEGKEQVAEPVEITPLQIEILNGCGVSGIAAEFTEYLRKNEIDVVRTDNYESFNVLETVIIDRRGQSERMIEIAEIIGVDRSRILKEVNEAYLIDATIVLGKDYLHLSSWQNMDHDGY